MSSQFSLNQQLHADAEGEVICERDVRICVQSPIMLHLERRCGVS
jgi:hypothetical protein